MANVLESTNTVGGIGMNNEVHRAEYDAWERGYREALLDVFCYLTGNEQVLEVDESHLALLVAMTDQVTAVSSRLTEVG